MSSSTAQVRTSCIYIQQRQPVQYNLIVQYNIAGTRPGLAADSCVDNKYLVTAITVVHLSDIISHGHGGRDEGPFPFQLIRQELNPLVLIPLSIRAQVQVPACQRSPFLSALVITPCSACPAGITALLTQPCVQAGPSVLQSAVVQHTAVAYIYMC